MNATRFWQYVDTEGYGGCWFWTGAKVPDGYGHVNLSGKQMAAHRAAWELTYGPIPDGLCVLHHCDNRACVKPTHLWLGTKKDNALDMTIKGRNFLAFGATNGRTILTDHEVRTLKRMYASGKYSANKLARIFVVSRRTVQNILTGKIWKHVK
jgi:hypothetical protein